MGVHQELIERLRNMSEYAREADLYDDAEYIADAANIIAERDALERRLSHLLLSETVCKYDALDESGGYVLNIGELDRKIAEWDELRAEVATLRGIRDSIKVAMPDPEIFYICDRRACDKCNEECTHTKDIRHAKSFEVSALGGFWEQEG